MISVCDSVADQARLSVRTRQIFCRTRCAPIASLAVRRPILVPTAQSWLHNSKHGSQILISYPHSISITYMPDIFLSDGLEGARKLYYLVVHGRSRTAEYITCQVHNVQYFINSLGPSYHTLIFRYLMTAMDDLYIPWTFPSKGRISLDPMHYITQMTI